MSDDFYRAFEDKYRGSRELIKSRLLVYLPFIKPLLSVYKDGKAIDLGCGRGEWLELLQGSGFDASGVDLDDDMLAACRERGLNVATQDAVAALKALPDASQVIVSGFHIAEHLPFSDLQLLVQEALRVLRPGGLLILETPNPENITVGTANFYLDPTHQRPIPPQLLSFLPEHYEYAKVKVLRLQEDKSLVGKAQTSLGDVLGGVSPDYAVVAQKHANDALLACNSVAFEREYGLTLGELTGKFDQQAQQASDRAANAEAQAQQASDRAANAEAQAQQASDRAANAEAQAQQASDRAANAEAQAQQASDRAVDAAAALTAAHTSSSWRLTAPLRAASRLVDLLLQRPQALKPALKAKARLLLAHASLYVNRRPKLRGAAQSALARFPTLKARVRAAVMNKNFGPTASINVPPNLAELTPHARQIYADLKVAIERRQKARS